MIPCVNCKKDVSPDDGKLFAQVFVCSICHTIATRLHDRAVREAKQLLTVLKEAIRIELIEGRLQFSTMEQVEEVPKRDLLAHLSDAAQRAKRGHQPAMPPRETPWPAPKATSQPPALTADEPPKSDSP